MFKPQLVDSIKDYSKSKFMSDLSAGVIVGIVALPLAIAFGIASGVTPEKGLITAVIAGFIISAFGGSKVQIGGPTGAFIVIVYGIVQQYGVNGLIIATFLAGIMLLIMGFARLGSIIKFFPHPLVVGFTSGIALIIFSSQIKDFLGLQIKTVPADFIEKWVVYFNNFGGINNYSFVITIATVIILIVFPKVSRKIPGSLIALIGSTLVVQYFHLPVETIGSKFGAIPNTIPMPTFPHIDYTTLQKLIQPAFTIALLGGIESLLSAVVADGMIGSTHKSNMELVAQGFANITVSLFGGIPATGAIARTATNVKNGAKTPVAGIIHALTLLLIMLFFGGLASHIPMACLAGILIVVAYNMSEWESFVSILNGPKRDAIVLVVSFLLTVLVDLTVAIEIGMMLSAFIFMERMSKMTSVNLLPRDENRDEKDDPKALSCYFLPKGIEVFEIEGPFFFGAAAKFKQEMKIIENNPEVLILRMRFVPYIDETGLHVIEEFYHESRKKSIQLILSGVQPQIYKELERAGLINKIGEKNVLTVIDDAIERANEVLIDKRKNSI
ncbi:MAG: sulfate permease [Candidatus Kapabacteria bacterium]|nr:sulfate permease [Candidatus Kapabacteria bacterium]